MATKIGFVIFALLSGIGIFFSLNRGKLREKIKDQSVQQTIP
jgi:hypothetical protein